MPDDLELLTIMAEVVYGDCARVKYSNTDGYILICCNMAGTVMEFATLEDIYNHLFSDNAKAGDKFFAAARQLIKDVTPNA